MTVLAWQLLGWDSGPMPVFVLSFGIGMCNLMNLLMLNVVGLFLRNWLLLGVPMRYGFVACV